MFRSTLFLALVITTQTLAQSTTTKSVTSREQVWIAYMGQARFTDKFGAWLDVQYRQTGEFLDRPFQFIFRPAATWFVRDNLRINLGYAFINHFPAEGKETSQPEHRTWQQVWFNQKLPHVTMLQWFRVEQRFIRNIANDQLVDGYTRGNRLRYQVALFIPIKGEQMTPGIPFIAFSDEVFMNFGKNVVYNTFDQNRMFIGLGYPVSSQINIQAGYLNVYQQQATGNQYTMSHALRVVMFHNLDFRE